MNYTPQLDGIRAIAILAVLYTHLLPSDYWLFNIYWGGLGVRLFFVLSGFLITKILLSYKLDHTRNVSNNFTLIKNFYTRRLLRLTPVFFLAITAAAFLNFPGVRDNYWWHVLYLSNIKIAISNTWPPLTAHFWSLAVEEQFYLLWPFFVIFLSIKNLKHVVLLGILSSLAYRAVLRIYNVPDITIWMLLPDSVDALMIGAALALYTTLYQNYRTTNILYLLGACAFVMWLILVFGWILIPEFKKPDIFITLELQKTLSAIYFSIFILWIINCEKNIIVQILSNRSIVFIGKISYSIYVIHFFVKHSINIGYYKLIGHSPPTITHAVLTFLLVLICSTLLWFMVELPARKLKNYFPI